MPFRRGGGSFRSGFGTDYGVTMIDGAMRGLLARSVVVLDSEGTVVHTEVVPDIVVPDHVPEHFKQHNPYRPGTKT